MILLLLLLSIFNLSCSLIFECNNIDEEIKHICKKPDIIYSVPASNLVEFDWDYLYIITGPREPSEVEEITETNYYKRIEDNSYCYIFIKDSKVTKQYLSYCRDMDISNKLTKGRGYVKYSPKQTIYVKKIGTDDVSTYRLLSN